MPEARPLIQFELIESDETASTWSEHLDTLGEGVHHIGFVVDDMDGKLAMLVEMGYPVIR